MKKASENFPATARDAALDAIVVRALERHPEVQVPVDFSAGVRSLLPLAEPARKQRSVGNMVGVAAIVVLVGTVCWLAPHAPPSFESIAFDVELLLLAELAGVAVWLSTKRRGM